MVIWGEGLKHPFRSPGWGGGKTPALCISFPVERPGGLGRGPCNSLLAALLGSRALRRGSCAGRGPPPPGGAWLPQLSRTPQGDVPAPKFWAAGYLPDLSPPLLQYHTHGTLVSPGEGQSGNKGVFVQRLPGGWESCSLAFPGAPGRRAGSATPSLAQPRAPPSATPAPEVRARRPGPPRVLFGRAGCAAAPGGLCRPRRDGGGSRSWRRWRGREREPAPG